MKFSTKVITSFGLLFFLTSPLSAQTDTADFENTDSLSQHTDEQTGFIKYTSVNPLAFQTYAGSSALNTLRGQVPGLHLGQDITSASPRMRNSIPMLLIDGMPYFGNLSSYYNLNTFDYSDVSVISSGNALTSFGAPGAPGAIVLHSKNGKDVFDPLVEVTWSPTLLVMDDKTESSYRESLISSNVAFAQDFGEADVRISLTSNLHRNGTAPGRWEASSHSFRINTGWEATDRLSFRLTHNNIWSNDQYETELMPAGISSHYARESAHNSRVTTLTTHYKISKTFVISSRASIDRINIDNEARVPGFNQYTEEVVYLHTDARQQEDQAFLNVMLKGVSKPNDKGVSWSGYVGVQNEHYSTEADEFGNSSYSYRMDRKYNVASLPCGYGFGYKNILFINADVRPILGDDLDDNTMDFSWSASSSFIFSNVLGLRRDQFFGRIRTSFGETSINSYGYNYRLSSGGVINSLWGNEPFPGKKMLETGMDIAAIDDRVSISATYYREIYDQTMQTVLVPNDATGAVNSDWTDIGKTHQTGWEFLLTMMPIKNRSMSYRTILSYAQNSARVEIEGTPQDMVWLTQYRHPNSSSRAGMMHLLTMKRFTSSILFETEQNSDYMSYDDDTKDDRLITLRDVSLGYLLISNGKTLRKLNLSASGRNLWKHKNYESTTALNLMQPAHKTFTLSLTACF